MIGSIDQLYKAASGKMPQKVFIDPAISEQPTPSNTDYESALQRRSTASLPYSDLLTQTGKYGVDQTGGLQGKYGAAFRDIATSAPTRTFANVLAGTGRTSAGTGKYGGFSNAGDLQTAIGGAAMGLRSDIAPQLRSQAEARYTAMDRMYRQALGGQTGFTTEYNPGVASPGNFRIAEQLASVPRYRQARENVQGYMPQLGTWYKEQAAPAEEYMQTAQQLERTPLSELASSIAVRGYGMDPNLAAGKFADLDTQYYTRERDREYMQDYGMPYEQYKTQLAETTKAGKEAQTASTSAMTSQIEGITGLSAKRLSETTGQTVDQMYQVLSQNYDVDGQVYNGAGAVQDVLSKLEAGDQGGAKQLVDLLQASAGGQSLGLFLNSLLKYYVSNPYKIGLGLEEAGL